MGEAKQRRRLAFADADIRAWEAEDCVNFAIALGRTTQWLLHVDWLSNSEGHADDRPAEHLIPLRVYVGDCEDMIFDVRGIKRISDFCDSTIGPLAKAKWPLTMGNGGVTTRTYSEEQIGRLPLRVKPDEGKVAAADAAIKKNGLYLAAIPARWEPVLPAKAAADFAWGRCAVYAQALQDLHGLPAVGLLVTELSDAMAGTRLGESGYVHSLSVFDDGTGEDSWGRQPMERIARRYGAKKWTLDAAQHARVVKSLQQNSPEKYQSAYEEAVTLIKQYRMKPQSK